MNLSDEKREYFLELERYYLRKASEARLEFIELSIIEDSVCPACGSRVYIDKYNKLTCTHEIGICPMSELLKVKPKEAISWKE